MLPVCGLSSGKVDDLLFKTKSFKVFFSLFVQFLAALEFVFINYYIVRVGLSLSLFGVIINYAMGNFSMFYMFYYATKWKSFMLIWEKHEETFLFPPYSNETKTKSFVRKVKVIGAFIVGFSIGEIYFL